MQLFYKPLPAKQKAALQALADGIECGAQLHPQCTNSLVRIGRDIEGNYISQTCALGAARECALLKKGITDEDERLDLVRASTDYDAILADYGVRNRMSDRKIAIDGHEILARRESDALSTLVFRLNDTCRWTREQIAAFLRDLE